MSQPHGCNTLPAKAIDRPAMARTSDDKGHVWRYQNVGLSYFLSSLIPQNVAGLSARPRVRPAGATS